MSAGASVSDQAPGVVEGLDPAHPAAANGAGGLILICIHDVKISARAMPTLTTTGVRLNARAFLLGCTGIRADCTMREVRPSMPSTAG